MKNNIDLTDMFILAPAVLYLLIFVIGLFFSTNASSFEYIEKFKLLKVFGIYRLHRKKNKQQLLILLYCNSKINKIINKGITNFNNELEEFI